MDDISRDYKIQMFEYQAEYEACFPWRYLDLQWFQSHPVLTSSRSSGKLSTNIFNMLKIFLLLMSANGVSKYENFPDLFRCASIS